MRRDRLWMITLLATLPGVIMLLLATRHGLSLGGDAATYLDIARSIGLGDGPTTSGFGATEPLASAHFPPLYPLLLTTVGESRVVHALLLISTGLLAAAVVAHFDAKQLVPIVVASLLVTMHADVLRLFAGVSSEALFVPLFLASVVAALSNRPWLTAAAVAGAMMTRHVGVALLILPMLAAGRKQWLTGVAATTVAATPYLVWRLWLVSQEAVSDRVLRWHPPTWHDWVESVASAGRWLLPVESQTAWPFALVGLVVLPMFVALIARRPVVLMAVAAYVLVVLVARSLFDATIPMGGRIWAPLVVVFVPLAVAAVPRSGIATNPISLAIVQLQRHLLVGLTVAVVASQLAVSIWFVVDRFRRGSGYASPAWRQSPTLQYAGALPPDVAVISNGADAIQVLLGRAATLPPLAVFPTAGRANTGRYNELRSLAESPQTIVWFDRIDRPYFVTPDDLRRYLDADDVARFDDGFVLRSR